MKIYHKDVNSLMLSLVNYTVEQFKNLSQTDRKICLKAIECLSSKEDRGVSVHFPDPPSFEKAIASIQEILDSKTKDKKNCLVRLIISVIKAVLNFFHLRISSAVLCKKVDVIKKSFLVDHWDQYLLLHCDVKANCDLSKAKIIFLGDTHTDFIQDVIRQNLISHYADEDQSSENLVLEEGLTCEFPRKLGGKKFIVESWEVKEHYQKNVKASENHFKLYRKFKSKKAEWDTLKNNKENSEAHKKKILEICNKLKQECSKNQKQMNKFKNLRDNDLIDKVKTSALKQNRKIFAIAGSRHLVIEGNYDIMDTFRDYACAVIIPKETNWGKQNTEAYFQEAWGVT